MRLARPVLVLLSTLALAAPAAADVSGNFVVKLGQDTTGFEHYTRTATRLDIQQVGRSPRVLQRHLTYDYDKSGAITKFSLVVTAPGAPASAPPMQRIDASFTADSMMMENRRDTSVTRSHFAVPAGTVLWTGASPWSLYEGQTMAFAKQKGDSLTAKGGYLGGDVGFVTVRRLGRDSVVIQTSNDLYHARIDREGRLLGTLPIIGTAKFSIVRVEKLDMAAMTASFTAREKAAGAMGVLSPRDTVRATCAGAAMWIDYSRPAMRGRTVFGGVLVPWNVLWRTGANAATQFHTDKALMFGPNELAAGTYTLWTMPSPSGWKLIVNSETGQWGTEHKDAKDMFSVAMDVTSLPQPMERFTMSIEPNAGGGVMHLDWDTTRASVPFTVKP